MHKLLARLGECVCKLLTLRMKEEKKKRMKEEASLYPLKTVEGPKLQQPYTYYIHNLMYMCQVERDLFYASYKLPNFT